MVEVELASEVVGGGADRSGLSHPGVTPTDSCLEIDVDAGLDLLFKAASESRLYVDVGLC